MIGLQLCPGFSLCHPQAPTEDAQGPLGVLYEIQEWFKSLTGLQGVTTQPVAGAQGELVGLKLFRLITGIKVNRTGILFSYPDLLTELILRPQQWLAIQMALSTWRLINREP